MSQRITVLGVTGLICSHATGGGITLMDQLGPADGVAIDPGTIIASQYFEDSFAAYDIGAVDDFANEAGLAATSFEMALTGWNGYAGVDAVQGLEANFYSSLAAAAANLVGDLASERILEAPAADPDWTLEGFDVVGAESMWPLPTGVVYVALIPVNEFSLNGQTACGISSIGDGNCWQTNPGGGWGIGPISTMSFNLAYRITTDGDPCGLLLPACHADVSGPSGVPDGTVGVDDLLATVGSFGASGDGTTRPAGDCFPLPAGDCEVTVDDLLEVISRFAYTCPAIGACCLDAGECESNVAEADCQGEWLGDGTSCVSCATDAVGACFATDGQCLAEQTESDCDDINGLFYGKGSTCQDVSCTPPPANDTCSKAIDISEGDTPFDITWALTNGPVCKAPGEPHCTDCVDFQDIETVANDVWFSYTASVTGILTLSTCDQANFDTLLGVYDLAACGSDDVTTLACSDDSSECSQGTSILQYLEMSSGTTYLIRVGAFSDEYGTARSGTLSLSVEESVAGACCSENDCFDDTLPAACVDFGGVFMGGESACEDVECANGDTCLGALTFLEGANSFNTEGLNASGTAAPDGSICEGTYFDWTSNTIDLWGRYEATGPGTIDVSLCDPASFDTMLAVYTGASCFSLNLVACNGDDFGQSGCQPNSSAVYGIAVDTGTIVYVQIGGRKSVEGSGTCTVTFHPADTFGACCTLTDCATLPEVACLDSGGQWYSGSNCDIVSCQTAWQSCTTGIGIDPVSPNAASWTSFASDAGSGSVRAAPIPSTSVTSCTVYGLAMVQDGGWSICSSPSDMTMNWTLYADEQGLPGDSLVSGVGASHASFDLVYSDIYQLQGWSFTPAFTGAADWLELKSLSPGQGACWFTWMAGGDEGAGAHAEQLYGAPWAAETTDLNYCISP